MDQEDRFLEEFLQDESEVRRYKERIRYGNYAGWSFLISLLVVAPVLGGTDYFTNQKQQNIIFVAWIVITSGSFLLMMVSNHYQSKSELTRETIAYHHLCHAVNSYKDHSFDESFEHLQECKTFLKDYETEQISEKIRDGLVEYVTVIEESNNPEKEIERTFERFSEMLINHIISNEYDKISEIIKDIKESSSEKMGGVERAINDIRYLLAKNLLGFWGVVISAFVVGYLVFHFYDKVLGAGVIGAILTAYGIYQRRPE